MGRSYAAVLGPLAFAVAVARGLGQRGGIESTLWQALIGLFLFAAIGAVIGQLAGWIVDDSVRARLATEIAAAQAETAKSAAKANTNIPATPRAGAVTNQANQTNQKAAGGK